MIRCCSQSAPNNSGFARASIRPCRCCCCGRCSGSHASTTILVGQLMQRLLMHCSMIVSILVSLVIVFIPCQPALAVRPPVFYTFQVFNLLLFIMKRRIMTFCDCFVIYNAAYNIPTKYIIMTLLKIVSEIFFIYIFPLFLYVYISVFVYK